MKFSKAGLGSGILTFGALALAGCPAPQNNSNTASNSSTTPSNTTDTVSTPKTGGLKVALLTPGDVNDAGWNQLAYEGLQEVEKESGAQTSHQVTKGTADHKPALNDYGDQKYNVVFCHGFEYGQTVKSVAPQFPDTKFVVVSGNVKQDPNVATLVPRLEEATYLAGMAAGGMTKTNVLGCIGGQKFPAVVAAFQAFEQGAKAVNPKVAVKTIYLNSWEDQNKGKEAANSLIAQKADMLIHNADQAGKGMFDAAKAAKGVLVFGTNRDQNDVAPQICLASAVIAMPHAFVQVVKSVEDKSFKPVFVDLNSANDNIELDWNATLKSKIPAPLLQKIETAEDQIKTGKLKIKGTSG